MKRVRTCQKYSTFPLTVGRLTHITLTGQKLGALLMATGGLRSGLSAWNYFFEEEEGARVLSFVSGVALRDVLTRELFSILSSTNERDRYLAFNLLRSVDEETLISDLLNAIKDEQNSVEVKKPAVRTLRAFSSMDETLKGMSSLLAALDTPIFSANLTASCLNSRAYFLRFFLCFITPPVRYFVV